MVGFIVEKKDVWQSLQETKKPIVLYGMGNGADQIIDWCSKNQVQVNGIFASDEFVRGQSFRGYKVETYAEVKSRLGDFLIVIAFASESEAVLRRFRELDELHEVLAPHLPLFSGDEVVTFAWLEQYETELRLVYSKLADDRSRQVFAAALNYKLSGKLCYLWSIVTERRQDLLELFNWQQQETYIDLGAYNGDTIDEFLQLTQGKYHSIVAVEPDRRNYKKLAAYVESRGLEKISIFERAAWNKATELVFSDSGGRQSSLLQGDSHTVKTIDVDTLLEVERATYIKMDVEGAELEALEGSRGQIIAYQPKLFVAAYHRDTDVFSIPLFLWQLVPEYKIYLRKHPYIPAWELNFLVHNDAGR